MEVFPISKKVKILLLVFLIIISMITFSEKAYVIDWEIFKNENEVELNNFNKAEDKAISKFNIAIAKANLGHVTESRKEFDEIEKLVGKKEFKNIITPYIKEIDEINDNILYLNYGAFYYLTFNNNKRSAIYFEEIIKKDPKNEWALSYLAANYIMLDNLNKAEKLLEKADKINSNNFSNLLFGYIYYKEGNYLRAMSRFSQSGNLIRENFIE